MNAQNFVTGTLILALSNLIIKILGAVFRIPLGNIILSDGIGYYQTAYSVFVAILAISTSGIPTAISKMVAERNRLGMYKTAKKVFTISIRIFLVFGILSFSLFFFGTDWLCNTVLKDKNAYYPIKALSLALLIVPTVNAFKGYFQGRSNMLPTSLCQISEQFVRVFSGLFLAKMLLPKGLQVAAGGAAFGASLGGIVAFLVIFIIYLKEKNLLNEEIALSQEEETERTGDLVKEMLSIAIPIIIGSLVIPIMNVIDSVIVKQRLMVGGISYKDANSLFGQFTGMAMTVVNLPQALTVSIVTSIVPAVSQSYVVRDLRTVRKNIRLGLRMGNLIAMPCFMGVMLMASPVMHLLYPKEGESVGSILFVMSFMILLIALLQTATAVLQALGKPMVPVIYLALATLVKLALTYYLTPIPGINVKGAVIGTLAAYFIAMFLDLLYIRKKLKMKFRFKATFLMPFIMSVIMGVFVKISYSLFVMLTKSPKISVVLAMLIGMLVYMYELFFMGGISKNELKNLPGTNRLLRTLYKEEAKCGEEDR